MGMKYVSELGRALHEEHFWSIVLINGLETRVDGENADVPLDPGNEADRAQLQELADLLEAMIRHHAFEEILLFPLIRQQTNAAIADMLARDHAAIGPAGGQLRRLTREILRDGQTPERWRAFRSAIKEFSELCLVHIQKEEMAIIQKLSILLDPETDRRLARILKEGKGGDTDGAEFTEPLQPFGSYRETLVAPQ